MPDTTAPDPAPVKDSAAAAAAAVASKAEVAKAQASAAESEAAKPAPTTPPTEDVVPSYTYEQVVRHAAELIGYPSWLVKEAIRKAQTPIFSDEVQFAGVDVIRDAVEKLQKHEVVKPGADDDEGKS